MAAYAALVSLMNNIEQMMNHPHLSNSFNTKQIQSLLEKSGFLLNIIEGNRYGGGSKEAEYLERQITSAAHAAEDIIESYIVDQIHAGSFEESRESMVDLQRIIQDMEALTGIANVIMKIEREEHEQPTHSTPRMETGEIAMVGLDDELIQLLDELTGHQSNRHTISIVGMGGIGKTTLARNLYTNPLTIEHFDVRAWATVSQQYDVKEILSQLLSTQGKVASGNEVDLGEQLHKALIGRRYLVVLDDMWSVEAWDRVRHYFPNDGNSSRVVLTTRLSNVASVCGSSCFTMNLLDEGKSWKLFCEKALFPNKDDPLQLEDVGKEIVRLCKGLALSIVVIGGLLLMSPRTTRYWKDVAKDLKLIPISKEKQQTLDVLSLSYSQLPPHLKPCFLYMGAFKEDSEIRVSTITRLWVAEGFIRPNGTRVLEDIAEGCLKDLIDRNLILVSKRRSNGEIGSCGIHDLLRDLCIKLAEQQEFFHIREGDKIRSTDRRVVCYQVDTVIGFRLARSILAKIHFAESIKCKLLRVLTDPRNLVHDPPADIVYGNVNLRYLEYRDPSDRQLEGSTWMLPTSVSLIWNLQTLMIFPYYERLLVVAPSKIWKMRQLRHIKFMKICLPPSDREDILENLQSLATAVNLRLTEEVCKIIPNIKKLGLMYHPKLQGYDDSLMECMCNLDRLLKLESLKMRIELQARDSELLKKLAFPSSLRKLSLSYCQLHWDDLRMIGSLPQLQVLSLERLSVTEGKQWSPEDWQFRHLKFLRIDECKLYNWDADNSHFPVLEKLVLSRLNDLKEIPLDIGEIPTLGLIRVELCSLSAVISAMRIKEYQLESQDNDALQIQIKVWEYQGKSFTEMVETEQLTLSYIQFELYP